MIAADGRPARRRTTTDHCGAVLTSPVAPASEVDIVQVDAFAARPFEGNPAAVCILDTEPDEGWMQAVAAEMNLSETAFAWPSSAGYALRWFTPTVEVDLCGHATLASAHVLFEDGHLARDQLARFQTRSGELTVCARDDDLVMTFPSTPAEPVDPPGGLLEALGSPPVVATARTPFDYLVEVADAATVLAVKPDFSRLAQVPVRGVIVTAAGDEPGIDVVSRFFGPAAGVDEDPVTGSAHCALAPWWAERLGREELTARQLSKRGGTVGMHLRGERVDLSGTAVTVLRARLVT